MLPNVVASGTPLGAPRSRGQILCRRLSRVVQWVPTKGGMLLALSKLPRLVVTRLTRLSGQTPAVSDLAILNLGFLQELYVLTCLTRQR